jgi:ABC-2 type transport system permease protein
MNATLRVVYGSFLLQTKDRVAGNLFFFTLLGQPVVFTLLSVGTYLYGKRPDFGLYAVIGAGMIGIWNTNLWTSGNIIRDERRSGTLALLLSSPTRMEVVLLGKSLSNAIASMLAMFITFGTGMLAFRLPLGIEDPLGFTIGLILTLVSMTCLGLVLGTAFILTRRAGAYQSVLNYPIFLLSGFTFPLTLLPVWIRPLSNALAPTWGNLSLNTAAGVLATNQWINYLWMIGLSVVYLFIARLLFQWVENLVRKSGTLEEW